MLICFGLNETGVPYQLSCCHFSWRLQDTLFTPVVECSTEGHLSFCEMKSHNRKHFYCYKKWFIWECHQDVISIPVKGSRASGSYEICLKPTVGKKRLLFQFKKQVIQLKWACEVKSNCNFQWHFFLLDKVYFKAVLLIR